MYHVEDEEPKRSRKGKRKIEEDGGVDGLEVAHETVLAASSVASSSTSSHHFEEDHHHHHHHDTHGHSHHHLHSHEHLPQGVVEDHDHEQTLAVPPGRKKIKTRVMATGAARKEKAVVRHHQSGVLLHAEEDSVDVGEDEMPEVTGAELEPLDQEAQVKLDGLLLSFLERVCNDGLDSPFLLLLFSLFWLTSWPLVFPCCCRRVHRPE